MTHSNGAITFQIFGTTCLCEIRCRHTTDHLTANSNVLKEQVFTGADEWERNPHIKPLSQTDLFLVHLFFCERKAVSVH